MLHANFLALCLVEWDRVIVDRSFTLRECEFSTFFAPVTLTFDPMTFIYELDPYSLEIYPRCENELPTSYPFESYRLTDRHIHIGLQTDRQDRNYIPRSFAVVNNNVNVGQRNMR